jgi:hypothetical protein
MFHETFSVSQDCSNLEDKKLYEVKGNLFNPNKINQQNHWNSRLSQRLHTYYNSYNQNSFLKKSTK